MGLVGELPEDGDGIGEGDGWEAIGFEQIQHERNWARDLGIVLDSDPAQVSSTGVTQFDEPADTQVSDREPTE